MPSFKILVTGAVGSGKTTLIRHLAENGALTTEARSTETPGKTETTVALDYGKLVIDGIDVRLFGTPGQQRFSFMWETLSDGADGMVVLVDAASEHAAERTDALLNTIYRANGRTPFVVGLTHTDLEEAAPEQALDGAFADDALALAPIDPRSDQAGHALLRRLLDHLSS